MAKRVLVVDDIEETREVIKFAMQREGCEVETARNGQDALTRASQSRPDLIITDLMMPIMDGFALLQELLRREDLRDIPVILITAKGRIHELLHLKEKRGFLTFCDKPFPVSELVEKAREALGTTPA